ncbi:sulfatase-like hydrolase/transferase [Paenibacillus sp. 1P07SE]|uniref:sulfatase-like hydrolase/transferase n=1 Tax=Paenibacillus sp. 1P07SE TaxID=3132209 RepID=UPI0039A46065
MDQNNECPNILIIQSDQHRYDCMGYSQAYPVHTPNIDRLAAEGMWFSNAYTPIPLCCPARQTLLSGKRPEAMGCLWNYDSALPTRALDPGEFTWTKELSQQGYRTGYLGKWHVNPHHDPIDFGFDEYISDQDYSAMRNGKFPDVRFENGFLGETDPVPLEFTRTHWTADQAVRLMEQYKKEGAPWHMRLDFHDPHLPCRPADPFATMYKPEDIPMWKSFRDNFNNKPYIQKQQLYNWGVQDYSWEDWAPIVARYYSLISQMDDAVGHVLRALERLGMADNTMVIYTSDHGDMCGGHRMLDKHYIMYDDVVKVPLVIRWPGKIDAGTHCHAFVYNALDLPPTLLEVAGLDAPSFLHGRSLIPHLYGEDVTDWRLEAVSTYNGQQFGLYTQRMIRTTEWKYVWNTTDVDELYHLRSDPDELINCIHEPRIEGILHELRGRLYAELRRTGDGLVASEWMKTQLLMGTKIVDFSPRKEGGDDNNQSGSEMDMAP